MVADELVTKTWLRGELDRQFAASRLEVAGRFARVDARFEEVLRVTQERMNRQTFAIVTLVVALQTLVAGVVAIALRSVV